MTLHRKYDIITLLFCFTEFYNLFMLKLFVETSLLCTFWSKVYRGSALNQPSSISEPLIFVLLIGLMNSFLPTRKAPFNDIMFYFFTTESPQAKESRQCLTVIEKVKIQNITRNSLRCNNRNDLLHLSYTLKISIFSEAYL